MRERTIRKWKPIIDGYDPDKGTIAEYCASIGINRRTYYHYRHLLYGEKTEKEEQTFELLPVIIIDNPEPVLEETDIHINGVPLTYQPSNVSDKELSRIIRLCRDL
ncbi:MAG: hypothetical protein IJ225_00785 [Solobacterium sp.]|nr:hypothetical protein [Solobacterium sp.]